VFYNSINKGVEIDGTTEYLDASTLAYTGIGVGITYITALKTFRAPKDLYVRVSFDVLK